MASINPFTDIAKNLVNTYLHSTMASINRQEVKEILSNAFHLHSTMASINPLNAQKKSADKAIYIPLWHLLIPHPLPPAAQSNQIYIPLWHLLIQILHSR